MDIVLVVQIIFMDGIFNFVVCVLDEDEMLRWFHEKKEEDKWLVQNEFTEKFSFKISSPGTHQICGLNLFTRFCVTSEYSFYDAFHIEIRNNTSGLSMHCQAYLLPTRYKRGPVREIQSLMHGKLGVGDPTFDDGDDVSISVLPHDLAIQVKAIGVQWLHEEERKDDDILSKDDVINAHNSSDDDEDAAHVAK